MAEQKPRKALIVLHQLHSTPGRVGRHLQSCGYELDIRRPPLGDPLPKTMAGHAGAIVFGGPMGANDDEDWIRREIDWLAVPLREEKPFLGLCLGAQMLAKQLGARVYTHDDRRGEVGYYPLRPLAAADALCGARFPRHAYQWHFDGFDVPVGAELLARGAAAFPNQAFRYGRNAVALQFHPEVTYQMMCRWTIRGEERLTRPGARQRREHLDGWFQHDPAVAHWLGHFLESWIEDRLSPPSVDIDAPEPERAEAPEARERRAPASWASVAAE